MTDCTRIELASSPYEQEQGLQFIDGQYKKAFGVLPSPPDHLLIAWKGEEVLGTIGVNTANSENGLRLFSLYRFNLIDAHFPLALENTVEFARWACKVPGISARLLLAALSFSHSREKKYVLCEQIPAVSRIYRKLGIELHPINAVRDDGQVEEYHRKYYQNNSVYLSAFCIFQASAALISA